MKLTEEIRSSLQPAQRKNFFDVRIGGFYRSEPAKGLTRVRLKLNQSAQSVESSEVTRARAFADGISRPTEQGYAGLPPEILAKEDRLVSRVAALKQSRNKMPRDKNPERYDNLTGVIEEAEKKLNSFVEMLWEKHRAYASVKYPRPVKLKESALRPEEHLVVFDVVGEGVGVKLIKGKKIISTFYVNWDLKDLEEQVRRFREPFEKMQLKDFDPDLGKTLYKKLLLRALVDVSEGTPLVTVPDGVLASLPFEVLVMGGKATWKEGAHGSHPDGLQYVGDVYPISYYQSITALTLARTLGKKKVPGKKLLVIADPVFSSEDDRVKAMSVNDKQRLLASLPQKLMTITSEIGLSFPRLTLTGDLGESLNKSYSGQVDLYTGMKAQKDLLFKKSLTEYRAIVFATHGYFGRDLPGIQEPVLALTLLDQPEGKDGFLRMSEVMGLELNADIVALTACQTGLGRRITGEGTMGMGRAFQYAGAKSVLMSLWNVAEKSSVKLVEYFFKHLKEGKSKLEALRLARKEIRETGYDHPFYWAPFILVGEID
jgi:CHAT domain-containing protein